ncbi:MAG: DNA primase [Patescibacteria group bacterium]|jgi:DNA primase
MQPSEEIKSKLDIVDVIREYIPLRPAGMNFRANCPFHNEKSPSFMVSSEKQIWHCFGCGKGGDVLSFVMEMEGLSFVETLRALAPRAGVVLKKTDSKIESKRNRLLDILEISAEFYHEALMSRPEAEPAREYLKNRGLKKETLEDWKIGYSFDSWDRLFLFLKKRGYEENEIFMAGMAVRKDKGGGFYDRFRGRIMFPIKNLNGNVAGFSARVSPEKEKTEVMGKYINSPATLVYDKSKILFGLHKAKMEIKKKNLAIITEGQMDVITSHQAGFQNTIASSGTALTEEQVKLIKRYTPNIALAFDSDAAGEMAAERGAGEAMAAGMNISVIEVPLGKDPDECIKKDPGEWTGAIANAKPIMQYFFDQTFSRLDPDKIDEKREAAAKLIGVISRLENRIEEDFWLRKLGQKIDVPENILRETLAKIREKQKSREEKRPLSGNTLRQAGKIEEKGVLSAGRKPRQTREELLSDIFLALLLRFPSHLPHAVGNVSLDCLARSSKPIYSNLIFYYNNIGKELIFEADPENLSKIFYEDFKCWIRDRDGGETCDSLDFLSLLGERDCYHLGIDDAGKEILRISIELKKNYLAGRLKEIEKLISAAEAEPDDFTEKENEMASLLKEFSELVDEKKGMDASD